MRASNWIIGVVCAFASIIGGVIYAVGFAGSPFTVESMFCLMPALCPLPFLLYLKSKRIGTAAQTLLYGLAFIGAHRMITNECNIGQCNTQSPVALVLASMLAGFQMELLLFAVLMMIAVTTMQGRRQPRSS